MFLATQLLSCANYEGHWSMNTMDKKNYIVEMKKQSGKEYYIYHKDAHISGVYEVVGKQMVMQSANDPRAEGFVMDIINSKHLRIRKEPSVRITNVRYTGSDLHKIEE